MSNPIVTEFHSTDVVTPCARQLYHRHRGEVEASMSTALFRGLMAHEVMEEVHMGNWNMEQMPSMIERAKTRTIAKAKDENRPLTDSVIENMQDITDDVSTVCSHYIHRQKDYFAQCKVIGVELPVRWTLQIEGLEPIEFASHIDLLYRNPADEICVRDFKYQDESPTMAYLGRNLQFALYHFVIWEGIVKVHDGDDGWVSFGEQPWMEVADLKNFKSYSRKTTVTDFESGQKIEYSKGDERPLANIIKTWRYSCDRDNDMKRELSIRPTLMRAGLWPTVPDKLGCHLCESKKWCPSFLKADQP